MKSFVLAVQRNIDFHISTDLEVYPHNSVVLCCSVHFNFSLFMHSSIFLVKNLNINYRFSTVVEWNFLQFSTIKRKRKVGSRKCWVCFTFAYIFCFHSFNSFLFCSVASLCFVFGRCGWYFLPVNKRVNFNLRDGRNVRISFLFRCFARNFLFR